MISIKYFFATLGLFLSINLAFSQDFRINNSQKLIIDHLENIYVIEKDNLSLISKPSKKEYQNNYLGNIFSVDISNPLRILIFHKDANQIIFLNNELSIIGEPVNLDKINLPEISVVCSSQINGFWIYNNLNNRVEFVNNKLKKTHSSIDLSPFINSTDDILSIKMEYKHIYLNVQNTGILVFDMFGTYLKTLPIQNIQSFQVLENSILYTKGKQILMYKFDTLETLILYQSETTIKYAKIINRKIFILTKNQLFTQSLEKIKP